MTLADASSGYSCQPEPRETGLRITDKGLVQQAPKCSRLPSPHLKSKPCQYISQLSEASRPCVHAVADSQFLAIAADRFDVRAVYHTRPPSDQYLRQAAMYEVV